MKRRRQEEVNSILGAATHPLPVQREDTAFIVKVTSDFRWSGVFMMSCLSGCFRLLPL